MQFITIKTRKFLPPKDDLFEALDKSLPKLKNGDVVFITSKVVSIHQGRCVELTHKSHKAELIEQEADYSLPKRKVSKYSIYLTIKNNILIPSAGIDESNAKGYSILWPREPYKAAQEICSYLKKKFQIKKLAVIITDSHTTPLHWGVTGISIGFFGLEPLFDYRGKKDIFGRKLNFTQKNVVDGITATAVLLMGEAAEQTPLAILRGANFIKFTNKPTHKKFIIDPKKDLYAPLLKPFLQRKNRRP